MPGMVPPELSRYVQQKVASGEFQSEDDFIAEATRLYRELETRHDRLRRDVDRALQQIDRGQGIELNDDGELRQFFDDIKARGRQRLEARKKNGQ